MFTHVGGANPNKKKFIENVTDGLLTAIHDADFSKTLIFFHFNVFFYKFFELPKQATKILRWVKDEK